MFVKPATGLTVRDPATLRPLPADGADVSDDSVFWHRRLRDGDVVLADSPVAPAKERAR